MTISKLIEKLDQLITDGSYPISEQAEILLSTNPDQEVPLIDIAILGAPKGPILLSSNVWDNPSQDQQGNA